MTFDRHDAINRAQMLHAEQSRAKTFASTLPDGEERDTHWMRGERLSDEAWALEEAHDLDPVPSGLWSRG